MENEVALVHMIPLEFPDLLWEVAMLGPQVVTGRGNDV